MTTSQAQNIFESSVHILFKYFQLWTNYSKKILISEIFVILIDSSILICQFTGPRSAVGNVSGNRCESDCRSRGGEFDPGPVPYFRGD